MPETEREPHRLMTTASADAPLKAWRYYCVPSRPAIELSDIRLTLVGRPKPGGDTEKLIIARARDVVESCKGISHEEMVKNMRVPRLPWCPLFTRVLVCQP